MEQVVKHNTAPQKAVEERFLAALEALPGLVKACHVRMGRPLGHDDLEEAIQETGLAAWRQRSSFRGDSEVETWLYGIARFTILNQLNGRRRRHSREATDVQECMEALDQGRSPISLADKTSLGRLVRENLAQAGDTAAAILCSHEVDGMTFIQIGESLSMKEATVKSRYYRALPALKDRLRGLWRDSRS